MRRREKVNNGVEISTCTVQRKRQLGVYISPTVVSVALLLLSHLYMPTNFAHTNLIGTGRSSRVSVLFEYLHLVTAFPYSPTVCARFCTLLIKMDYFETRLWICYKWMCDLKPNESPAFWFICNGILEVSVTSQRNWLDITIKPEILRILCHDSWKTNLVFIVDLNTTIRRGFTNLTADDKKLRLEIDVGINGQCKT